jgi:hypothetical protein
MSEGTIFAKMDGKDVRVYVYRLLWSAVSYYHFGFTVGTPEKENDVLHSKSAITFRGDNHPMGHKFSLCEYHQYNSDNELFNVKLLIEILEPQEKRVKNEDANGYRYYYIRYKAALTAFLEI